MYRKPFNEKQFSWLKERIESEGLALNEKKTRVVDTGEQLAELDFLGFNFKRVPWFWKKGQWYLKVQHSKKSQKKFKDRIRSILKHRTSKTLTELIVAVIPVITGW
jgi:RNA-directed DNA polymerase